MKAVIYTKYGSPEALQIQEISKPIPENFKTASLILARRSGNYFN
jgi:NADPH:quinone reductase-like Zn-dependent oxidoreductase